MKYAPIALFVYNRIAHTKEVLNSLKANDLTKKSTIYIFSDGPKNKNDINKIKLIRKYLKKINFFKKIIFKFRNNNLGLSKSLITGIDYVLNKEKKIIVLEDDTRVGKYFLNYMNDALNMYEKHNKVSSISGYVYPINTNQEKNETFFIRGADCWGWGTWKRAWSTFEKDGEVLINKILKKKLSHDFNFSGSIDLVQMLQDQIDKKNDSWAVRWIASNYLQNKLILYPNKSLVQNIGNEGSGTHNLKTNRYNVNLFNDKFKFKKIKIKENKKMRQKIEKFFYSFSRYYYIYPVLKFLKKYKNLKI